ncbi:ParB/RepB/Spo0J family partition protein [Sphingobium sp. SJ10-10]|uniref:ParB/RepB/Spo0J family partition protein n=1 Tax=Sphingobium sp. SJ10-10 TaxID=3114999 RepID=UPI002E1757E7|nr:ParB/RepB/Spo0J family partition protein [Sphingobium sp. SJ10-10]
MQDYQNEMFPDVVVGITDAEVIPDMKPEPALSATPAFSPKSLFVDAEKCVVWQHTARDADKLVEADIRPLAESIKASGQQVPVRVRRLEDDRLEIVAGVRRWKAVRLLNDEGYPVKLLVQIVQMDEDAAFRFAAAENGPRSDLTPIERARFYQAAIDHQYHTGKACADAFGLHKASISRVLDVLRVLKFVGKKIDDHRAISAAQASWLMSLIRNVNEEADPTDEGLEGDRHAEVIAAIDGCTAGSAAEVFGQLRQALAPSHKDGGIDIVVDDDIILGSVTRSRSGAVRIAIGPEAGAIELPMLIASIRVALTTLRAG